jgi:hypothetical protein
MREASSKVRIARVTVAALSLVAASLVVIVTMLAPAPVHLHTKKVYTYIAAPTLEPAEIPCASEIAAVPVSPTSVPLASLRRPWLGVSPSPDQSTLALWTESELFVSSDGGLRVEPIAIDGNILAAATSPLGTVWVLSSTQGGARVRAIVDAKIVEDHAVPMTPAGQVEAFTASDRALALVAFATSPANSEDEDAEPEMHIFNTMDASWATQDLPSWGNAGNSIVVAQDGSVDLMGGSEASCGGGYQYHFRSSLGAEEWQEVAWPMDAPFGFVIGAAGWSYALDDSCIEDRGDDYQSTLCAADPEGKLHRVRGADTTDQLGDAFLTAGNGKTQVAAIGGKLVSLHGNALETLATLPAPATAIAVDHEGHALVMSSDNLWRWSPDGGWQSLAPRLAASE